MKITIKHIPKQSTNKLYSGRHWSYRDTAKTELYQLIRLQTKYEIQGECDINYSFFWTGRVLDSDNNSVVGKMITDILSMGKDTYKSIHRVSYESEKSETGYNYCEIEIVYRPVSS